MAAVPLAQQRTEIAELLGRMCVTVGAALRQSTSALLDDRERLAAQVEAGNSAVEELRAKVEQLAITAMALHAPVAGDLRAVVAAIRCADDIARMGDLAKHVARTVRRQGGARIVPDEARALFAEMGSLGAAMADKAAKVARDRNVVLALELDCDDDAMDQLLRDVFEMLLAPTWTHSVSAAVDVTLLARYYERFADHAVSVAKQVVYTVTGQTVDQVATELAMDPEE